MSPGGRRLNHLRIEDRGDGTAGGVAATAPPGGGGGDEAQAEPVLGVQVRIAEAGSPGPPWSVTDTAAPPRQRRTSTTSRPPGAADPVWQIAFRGEFGDGVYGVVRVRRTVCTLLTRVRATPATSGRSSDPSALTHSK